MAKRATTTTRTTTPAAVNKVLKQRGHAERLRRGRGYYYFVDGNASAWFSSSIPCMWLVGTPERFADMRDELANDARNEVNDSELPLAARKMWA